MEISHTSTVAAPVDRVWATRLLGVRLVGVHQLAAVGPDHGQLTLRVLLEGRGAAVLGRLTGRSLEKALAAEAAGFARAASAATT